MGERDVDLVSDGHRPVEGVSRVRGIVGAWTRERGSAKNVTLVVIHGSKTSMSFAARATIAKMTAETESSRLASASVVLGGGMVGALHRSILTGFSILVPPPHPVK